MKRMIVPIALAGIVLFGACTGNKKKEEVKVSPYQQKADEFAEFKLTTDLSQLSEKEKQMLPLLFEAAKIAESIFWKQAYGDKNEVLAKVAGDIAGEKFVNINYGPWERLNDNKPFVEGYSAKPKGSQFYPTNMTEAEFKALNDEQKASLYTMVTRNAEGKLEAVPYHIAFEKEVKQMAALVKKASELAEDAGLKKYLELRAKALLTDDYYDSDIAWLDMKTNGIDFIIGPIENYEDQLYGYKAAYESFILIKDKEWSKKLVRFAKLLPELQKQLPCEAKYKADTPGSDSDLNAYDAVFYAGDCNAGSKTIAINLPNDERVRANKGSRKLQLKNSMQAKFDKILTPISNLLIDESQRKHVKFDAFFENTMFHEVAHGLGMGKTCDGKQTVREALKETYTSIEEGKADIVGLWCVTKLYEMGELKEKELMDNFVTFMAGIFRSVRFGAASAHGKANMMRFNYFSETGAFVKDATTGTYKVDFDKMKQAMLDLSATILKIQGDGDYATAKKMIEEKGNIGAVLKADLDRIAKAGIPRDIVFVQGKEVLGL
ncbi:Zn-dependent hydrolase [Prolixibacteraceae bacterium JC049]|nr:Zn-dependent hydrolase [Prolixibacteraceae bacterium JC049]